MGLEEALKSEAHLFVLLAEEAGGMLAVAAKINDGALLQDEHPVEQPVASAEL